MKSKLLKVFCSVFIIISIVLTFSACKKEPTFSITDFNKHENTVTRTFSFMANDTSESLKYDEDKLKEFIDTVRPCSVTYGYDELFNYDQAIAGFQVDHSVVEHKHSALKANGQLTKDHLFDIVRENNSAYLDGMTSLIKDVDDELLLRICEIIVDTVNDTLSKYPDVDKARVYCNLGNLKIVKRRPP